MKFTEFWYIMVCIYIYIDNPVTNQSTMLWINHALKWTPRLAVAIFPQVLMNCPASRGRQSLRSAPCVNRGRFGALVDGRVPSGVLKHGWKMMENGGFNGKITGRYGKTMGHLYKVYTWKTHFNDGWSSHVWPESIRNSIEAVAAVPFFGWS